MPAGFNPNPKPYPNPSPKQVPAGFNSVVFVRRGTASIGAAGAVEANGFLGDSSEGSLNASLNGVGVCLDLPAAEGCAVIGDGEFKVHLLEIYQPR